MLGLVLFALVEISSQIARLQRLLAQISEDNLTRYNKQTDISLRIESILEWIRQTLVR